MNRVDPFFGYSVLLRVIVFVIVPAFTAWQAIRLRRALHILQLEGYKRKRFLQWCRRNTKRALFLGPSSAKKPLVMTGRAWRILVLAVLIVPLIVLGTAAAVHSVAGAPFDLITWLVVSIVLWLGAPLLLVVADVLLVPLQRVINLGYEREARHKLAAINPVVIGVTGSFGKTSTKLAISTLLGESYATPGSYNTPMGVVRAVNEGLQPSHQAFVVEMGAYKEGEIADLCRLVSPSVGVLTAIGPAHLERFGSLDAIRRAKYEIVTNLTPDGIAVMNVDDPEVRALADATDHVRVVRYGLEAEGDPDYSARDLAFDARGMSFTLVEREGGSLDVTTRLLGRHAVGHILAAVAVTRVLGHSLEEAGPSIADLEPVEHRLQVLPTKGRVTVIDDAYNSNPAGAAAALEVLAAMPAEKRVVVSPGIIELGPLQREANEIFGREAATVADTLIVVAKVNRDAILTGARGSNGKAQVLTVDSLEEASKELQRLVSEGDVVLFENDLPDQYEG